MAIIVRKPPPCPACRALVPFDHENRYYDLYICLLRLHSLPIADPEWPTFMARFGPGADDFVDGPGRADGDQALREARGRAIEQGLYDPNKPLSPLMKPVVNALVDLVLADIERFPVLPEREDPPPAVARPKRNRRQ